MLMPLYFANLMALENELNKYETLYAQYINPLSGAPAKQAALDYFISLDRNLIPMYRNTVVYKKENGIKKAAELLNPRVGNIQARNDPALNYLHTRRQIALILLGIKYEVVSGRENSYIAIAEKFLLGRLPPRPSVFKYPVSQKVLNQERLSPNLLLTDLTSVSLSNIVKSTTIFKPLKSNAGVRIRRRDDNTDLLCYHVEMIIPPNFPIGRKYISTRKLKVKRHLSVKRQNHHMSDCWDNRSNMMTRIPASQNIHNSHLTKITISNQQEFDNFCIYLDYTRQYYNYSRLLGTSDIASNGFLDMLSCN